MDNTFYAKEKLIRILAGDVLIPKQRWDLCKILATLIYYQKDPCLCSAFCQFCSFTVQTLMTKSEYEVYWPGSLTCKDCNIMIRLCFGREMEKKYTHEVQKLCKTFEFGRVNKSRP